MVFSAPQWLWRSAAEPQVYGFVNNSVHVHPTTGTHAVAYVQVPTEFFQLLDTIFPGEERTHAAVHGVQFYLDQAVSGWVFGCETADAELSRDLWLYTQSRLPPWAELALSKKY
jgi:hypothetical protein